jgi:hypothetical protein
MDAKDLRRVFNRQMNLFAAVILAMAILSVFAAVFSFDHPDFQSFDPVTSFERKLEPQPEVVFKAVAVRRREKK